MSTHPDWKDRYFRELAERQAAERQRNELQAKYDALAAYDEQMMVCSR